MNPELNENRLLNRLLYVNRRHVLTRLGRLLEDGCSVVPYAEYVAALERDADRPRG
jgi:hypothetical protein